MNTMNNKLIVSHEKKHTIRQIPNQRFAFSTLATAGTLTFIVLLVLVKYGPYTTHYSPFTVEGTYFMMARFYNASTPSAPQQQQAEIEKRIEHQKKFVEASILVEDDEADKEEGEEDKADSDASSNEQPDEYLSISTKKPPIESSVSPPPQTRPDETITSTKAKLKDGPIMGITTPTPAAPLRSRFGIRPYKYDPEFRLVPGSHRFDTQQKKNQTQRHRPETAKIFIHDVYFNPNDNQTNRISLMVLSQATVFTTKTDWPSGLFCAYYDRDGKFTGRVEPLKVYTRSNFFCDLPSATNTKGSDGDRKEAEANKIVHIPSSVFVYRNVSLSDGSSETWSLASPPWTKRIQNNAKRAKAGGREGTMALCLKVLYKSPNWLMLLQFFEYYIEKGIDRFFIKIRSDELDAEVDQILRYYYDQGLLDAMAWDTKTPVCVANSEFCALEQIQDCVSRTAFLYNYTVVLDFDEMIRGRHLNESLLDIVSRLSDAQDDYNVPKKPIVFGDGKEMVVKGRGSEGKKHCGSFTFRAEYHLHRNVKQTEEVHSLPWADALEALSTKNVREVDRKAAKNEHEPTEIINKAAKTSSLARLIQSKLPWLNFRYIATGFTPYGFSPKTIVRPEQIRKQWVHFTREFIDPFRWTSCDPSDHRRQGYFYHFKNTTAWGAWINTTYSFTSYKDRNLTSEEWNYGLELVRKVTQVIKNVYKRNKKSHP